MNGWRVSMEDSHVIIMQDTWGFFGVCDGHGGDQCSTFIAQRLHEELANGPPEDDASMTALMLRLDTEFLETKRPSGSTGTFVLVEPPSEPGGRYHLRLANIGDSRILLARADGSMVEGPGSDGALTTDHKPDHPSERARIERTGGYVRDVMHTARVNGDLSVSRAFGDAPYKETGGPGQEDHPVCAAPELTVADCDPTDFLMLVCDGISEGNFPNRSAVKLAAEKLRASGDPAAAATAVCREALACGSKDNLSCMIVLLGGGTLPAPENELLPGPFEATEHAGYRKAYGAMAAHAGYSLPEALALRYECAQRELQQLLDRGEGGLQVVALREELMEYAGDGQVPEKKQDQVKYFADWLVERKLCADDDAEIGDGPMHDHFLGMLRRNPQHLYSMAAQRLIPPPPADLAPKRVVQVGELSELQPSMESHENLTWDTRLAQVCGKVGTVIRDDESDGTSQVTFSQPIGLSAWLPMSVLTDVNGEVVDNEEKAASKDVVCSDEHEKTDTAVVEEADVAPSKADESGGDVGDGERDADSEPPLKKKRAD